MKKIVKVRKESVPVSVTKTSIETPKKVLITEVNENLGREELNLLAIKLNEVIKHINAL